MRWLISQKISIPLFTSIVLNYTHMNLRCIKAFSVIFLIQIHNFTNDPREIFTKFSNLSIEWNSMSTKMMKFLQNNIFRAINSRRQKKVYMKNCSFFSTCVLCALSNRRRYKAVRWTNFKCILANCQIYVATVWYIYTTDCHTIYVWVVRGIAFYSIILNAWFTRIHEQPTLLTSIQQLFEFSSNCCLLLKILYSISMAISNQWLTILVRNVGIFFRFHDFFSISCIIFIKKYYNNKIIRFYHMTWNWVHFWMFTFSLRL